MTKGKLIGSIAVVLIGLAAIVGTFLLASNNPVKEDGKLNDATDVLAGGAAAGAGREARDPLINTEQGNMLVFFFTLASLTGGGIIGYNWRSLMRVNDGRKTTTPAGVGNVLSGLAVAAWIVIAALEGFSGNPIFDPELGDLVLFIFASTGAVIGFFAGYQFQGYSTGRKMSAGGHPGG